MRRPWVCVPMMSLCLLLCACGGSAEDADAAQAARAPYQEMESCSMTAEVSAAYGDEVSTFTLKLSLIHIYVHQLGDAAAAALNLRRVELEGFAEGGGGLPCKTNHAQTCLLYTSRCV